jgi:hypothetical protein
MIAPSWLIASMRRDDDQAYQAESCVNPSMRTQESTSVLIAAEQLHDLIGRHAGHGGIVRSAGRMANRSLASAQSIAWNCRASSIACKQIKYVCLKRLAGSGGVNLHRGDDLFRHRTDRDRCHGFGLLIAGIIPHP